MSSLLIGLLRCLRSDCSQCVSVDTCDLKRHLIDWARANATALYGPDPEDKGWHDALAEVL